MKPYYSEPGITLYHGDNRDVMAALPAETVDLVFTSPPYNLGNSSGGGIYGTKLRGHYPPTAGMAARGGSGKWRSPALADGYKGHSDDMEHVAYVAWQHEFLTACWRLLSPTGAIFYNHKPRILDGRLVSPFEYVPPELQSYIRQVVIWQRSGGINFSPAFYLPTHEWIVIIAKPAWRLKSKGASGIGDVWTVTQETNNPHPAPFPIGLPARAMETTPAGLVLDPFSGSGTVLRAAKNAGRPAIGIELSESYCRMTVARLQQEAMCFDEVLV